MLHPSNCGCYPACDLQLQADTTGGLSLPPPQHDEGLTTKRGRFMNHHQLAVRAGLAAATAGGAAAAAQLPATFVGGLLPVIAISMAYAAPLLPGGHSMRTAPGGKTAVACSMWALGCTWLPAVASGQAAELGSLQLAAMLLHTFLCSATVSGEGRLGRGWCGGPWASQAAWHGWGYGAAGRHCLHGQPK